MFKRILFVSVGFASTAAIQGQTQLPASGLISRCHVSITPANNQTCNIGSVSDLRWTQCGITLKNLVAIAFNFPFTRIEFSDTALGNELFDASSICSRNSDKEFRNSIQKELEQQFNLSPRYESRVVHAMILSGVPTAKEDQNPLSKLKVSRTGIEAQSTTMAGLANALEMNTGRPVVDETYLGRRQFSFQVGNEHPRPTDGIPELLRQIGLDLSDDERPVEYLIVDRSLATRSDRNDTPPSTR